MNTRFPDNTVRRTALIGAVAWLALAAAWQTANRLEQTRDWEGLPQTMYFVGLVGLLIGGLALGVLALNPTGPVRRPSWRVGGLALLALGLALSFLVGWAVPVWAATYALAMLSLAWSGVLSTDGWVIGGAFAAATAAFFVLTALEVGAADSFGDYPVAWMTATWLAALGASIGLVRFTRSLTSDVGGATAT